jgi:hypothetical protein
MDSWKQFLIGLEHSPPPDHIWQEYAGYSLLRKGVVVGMGSLPLSFLACVVLLSVLFVTSSASAQQAAPPVGEGVINPFHSPSDTTSRVDSTNAGLHSFHLSDIPSWMTLDMQLRGRTEEQTALGYVSSVVKDDYSSNI